MTAETLLRLALVPAAVWLASLAAILGKAAHLLAFVYAGRRAHWPLSLAAGWTSFATVAMLVASSPRRSFPPSLRSFLPPTFCVRRIPRT